MRPTAPPAVLALSGALTRAILLLAPASIAHAQQAAPAIPVGERVRVVAGPRELRDDWFTHRYYAGWFVGLRGDTVVVDRREGRRVAIPFASVVGIDRSRGGGCGHTYHHPGRCIAAGAFIGAALVSLPVVAAEGQSGALEYLVVTTPFGLMAGGIIGGILARERWERIWVPPAN